MVSGFSESMLRRRAGGAIPDSERIIDYLPSMTAVSFEVPCILVLTADALYVLVDEPGGGCDRISLETVNRVELGGYQLLLSQYERDGLARTHGFSPSTKPDRAMSTLRLIERSLQEAARRCVRPEIAPEYAGLSISVRLTEVHTAEFKLRRKSRLTAVEKAAASRNPGMARFILNRFDVVGTVSTNGEATQAQTDEMRRRFMAASAHLSVKYEFAPGMQMALAGFSDVDAWDWDPPLEAGARRWPGL